MNITISNYDDLYNPHYAGGGAIGVHEVAKRLARKNNVTVITGNYPGAANKKVDGVMYKRIGPRRLDPRLSQILYQVYLLPVVIKSNFDVWIETFLPPFSVSLVPLLTHKPVAGLSQSFSAIDKSRQYHLPFFLIEKIGLKWYRHIIALTEDIKKKIHSVNPNVNVVVIPNGTNLNNTVLIKNKKSNYLLFLGRIEVHQKGLDLLLASFKKAADLVNTNLYIAGKGIKRDENFIKDKIKKLHLQDSIKILGFVKGAEKLKLLQNANAVVLSSRYETQSLTAVEAISLGVPVIYFDIEGLRWIGDKRGIRVPPFDTQKFADAMIKISNDEDFRKKMIRISTNEASNYNWDTIAQKYETFINKIIS